MEVVICQLKAKRTSLITVIDAHRALVRRDTLLLSIPVKLPFFSIASADIDEMSRIPPRGFGPHSTFQRTWLERSGNHPLSLSLFRPRHQSAYSVGFVG
ncbi:hypothetical protein MVEN_00356000 [Mycena venus]|uniref:Uncharacterized protein n=1 Tax=Mycena venus TaxID=2733690 RepID=A0A8H7D9U5_9AGAR|nr:hypothetical protein MVEN_00356000 [Mycena venus]